ncbi:MAG: hypothetical protein KAS72_12745 [Phycisphaerales bacterium]|nr:hypothetical protein [Phycisphaerales bacterium]
MSKQPFVEDSKEPAPETSDDRRDVVDRRMGLDRRECAAVAPTGLEQRRGPGRRRTDFSRAAEEGEMTQEQFLFIMAVDAFKRVNGKSFPSWTDVLEVIRRLGYRKVQPMQLKLSNCEDWVEPADAPLKITKPGEAA